MTAEASLILLAIGFAAGVTLLVAGFVPARPRLSDILADREPMTSTRPDGRLAQIVMQSVVRVHIKVPAGDLDLVGEKPEVFILRRFCFALVGAVWVPLLTSFLAIGQLAPPLFFTGVASLVAAGLGWLLPSAVLKAKVQHVRATFRAAVASYCHLVALGRLGDRGPVEALRYPASLGTGWAFRRIHAALDEAALRGQMPWEGLEQLAKKTGVRELNDLGHIITSAGREGASVADTLRAKAASIIEQQLAERKTGSSTRSDRMDMPIALMGMAFIVFLAFPGIYTMLGG